MTSNTDWMSRAHCAEDPSYFDTFFPSKEESSREKYSRARRICAACPVKSPCGAYAISNHVSFGMWGGMTQHERKNLTDSQKLMLFKQAREEVRI